ncbi:hypothetical protein [Actinoplanes solisilvae]|uniref:hypothetical protein n=1 Tax=Actinoplanes solisilvae TaxID=2486853 RepID=UPI000FDB1719|nr:hypothetical protein [Actinoplanes solisilvae]
MKPDDVTRAVALAREMLTPVREKDWHVPAGDLTWTCWETIEHTADDLFAYAAQLAPVEAARTDWVPFGFGRSREGGPNLTIFVEPEDGPDGLLAVLESSGALLAAMVATAPADRLTHHSYSMSDPSGFAAMGVVEVLVHLRDVAAGLDVDWQPPADLCAAALARLFRDVPGDTDPWSALLWTTGRIELPGRPRQTSWKWDATPR